MAVIDEHPVISGSPATVRCSQEQLRFSQQLIPLSSGRQPSRYDVMLVAGSRSVQAKALAEAKSVTIALPDRPLNERVRVANILEVRGEERR